MGFLTLLRTRVWSESLCVLFFIENEKGTNLVTSTSLASHKSLTGKKFPPYLILNNINSQAIRYSQAIQYLQMWEEKSLKLV